MPTITKQDNLTRTIPWGADELIQVNGYALVYTQDADGNIIVQLPGKRSIPVPALIAQNAKIVYPKRWRGLRNST